MLHRNSFLSLLETLCGVKQHCFGRANLARKLSKKTQQPLRVFFASVIQVCNGALHTLSDEDDGVETVLRNFLYFYAYELIKASYYRLGFKPSALGHTGCGVLAGIANLTVTMPIEALTWPRRLLPSGSLLLLAGIGSRQPAGIDSS